MEHIVTMVKGKNGPIECVILPLESNYIEKTEKDGSESITDIISLNTLSPMHINAKSSL